MAVGGRIEQFDAVAMPTVLTLSADMHVPSQRGAAISFMDLVAGGSEEQLEWALEALGPAGVSSQVRACLYGPLTGPESLLFTCG